MTFGSGWALVGLALLAPLVALHLRNRNRDDREVPSLLLWRELEASPRPARNRGFRLPRRPLLLALEALALVLFVIALAQPRGTSAEPRQSRHHGPRQLAADVRVRTTCLREVRADEDGRRGAGRRSGRDGVLAEAAAPVRALPRRSGRRREPRCGTVKPSAAPSALSLALTVAAGLAAGPADTITVIRAPGDRLPRQIAAASHQLRTITVGGPSDDQGIFDPSARCGIGVADACEIEATLANLGSRPSVDRVTAKANGRQPLRFTIKVLPGKTAPIVLGALAGEQVTLRLDRADAVPSDNTAWISVPGKAGPNTRMVVTLVGTPGRALALAQAFHAVPGVELRLRTPSNYRPVDARSSALTILDRWLPKAGLPPSPSVLLVNPPRVPGGRVDGELADTDLTGTDPTNPLLEDVDLSSLAIDRGAARAIKLPLLDRPGRLEPRPARCSPPGTMAGRDSRSSPSSRLLRTCRGWQRFRCWRATWSAGRAVGRLQPPMPAGRSRSMRHPGRGLSRSHLAERSYRARRLSGARSR